MFEDTENWRSSREGFGEALLELGEENARVVVLTCDLSGSTRAKEFGENFPGRFFQFGVAEQNMMCVAAGMSLVGYIPFVCTYGVFSAGRCWEQLRLSICYSGCNVKIEGAHAGLLVGPDGASHQATEDIAALRSIPNLTILVPSDSREAREMTLAAAKEEGPVYIRLGREPTPILPLEDIPFIPGVIYPIRLGRDVTIFACGSEVFQSLIAAEELEEQLNLSVSVINVSTLKPIDGLSIVNYARTGAVVTVEEHQVIGGLGGAVAEVLSKNRPVPIEMVGIEDRFGTSGQPMELINHFGLNARKIKEAVLKVLSRKGK